MAIASVERSETAGGRFDDVCRESAHIAHEARLLKVRAEDALEDGVQAAKRAVTSVRRRVEAIGDLKGEALHRVKRHPVLAVGAAFGVGWIAGVAVGAIASRVRREWKL